MARLIDPEQLIDATETAEILGLAQRNSVSVYRHRYADFPEPIVQRGQCTLWLRADIEQWKAGRS